MLGSVVPCALFYFLQLYLKRNRHPSSPSDPSASSSSDKLQELSASIPQTLSRSLLLQKSPSGPAPVSSRASNVINKVAGGDSVSIVGYKKWVNDPYHECQNLDGVMQLSLAENHVGLFVS